MPPISPNEAEIEVFGGVDTHCDTHTAAAIDQVGRVIGTREFPATAADYGMRGHGRLNRVGVEGTGAYGAGLARLLRDEHVSVRARLRRTVRQCRAQHASEQNTIDIRAAAGSRSPQRRLLRRVPSGTGRLRDQRQPAPGTALRTAHPASVEPMLNRWLE
ncbi:hypothetical protein [Actinoplanes regularis]|uniref:Transposase n=1 Tax=Actinoplanes regularis TaxID=52697 RepID=A0A239FIB9_9ACTN|nr:hypothetical protein [Actinoplanes regularis]GIE89600.1 hypothetical protein Are01nite_60800 [Actinoplanes regularis]SNS56278.1 hypothetical protein SAMN06264365_11881 [Actinoplanes regularis]